MTEADARAVAAWSYEPPYDIYNVPPAQRDETIAAFLAGYHAAHRAGELVGFCCFGPDARVPGGDYRREDLLDVGLGLRPDLTGQGLGLEFVRSVVAFADETRRPPGYRLTVAGFNRRAIRVYERAGFAVVGTFWQADKEWVQMAIPAPG